VGLIKKVIKKLGKALGEMLDRVAEAVFGRRDQPVPQAVPVPVGRDQR
jgi:hypothetical protein